VRLSRLRLPKRPILILRAIRSLWHDTSATARRLLWVMLPAAASLSILGIVGDLHDFWNDRPFVTNFFSSFVGAMCGIPVAVILIQRITADQASHAMRRQRIIQAISVTQKMRSDALEIVKGPSRRLISVRRVFIDTCTRFDESIRNQRFGDSDLSELRKRTEICVNLWDDSIASVELNGVIARIIETSYQLSLTRELALAEGYDYSELLCANLGLERLRKFAEWRDIALTSLEQLDSPSRDRNSRNSLVRRVNNSLQTGRRQLNCLITLIEDTERSMQQLEAIVDI
jgi:hypothetical protein